MCRSDDSTALDALLNYRDEFYISTKILYTTYKILSILLFAEIVLSISNDFY